MTKKAKILLLFLVALVGVVVVVLAISPRLRSSIEILQPSNPDYTINAERTRDGVRIVIATVEVYGCSNYGLSKTVSSDGTTIEIDNEIDQDDATEENICLTSLGPATASHEVVLFEEEVKRLEINSSNGKNSFEISKTDREIKIVPTKLENVRIPKEAQTLKLLPEGITAVECYYMADGVKSENYEVCAGFFDAVAATGRIEKEFDSSRLPTTIYVVSDAPAEELLKIMTEHHDSRYILEIKQPFLDYNCEGNGDCRTKESYWAGQEHKGYEFYDFRYLL